MIYPCARQNEANVEGAEELFSLYAACRMGEHSELMLATEMDEDEEEGASYFLHLTNPKRVSSCSRLDNSVLTRMIGLMF